MLISQEVLKIIIDDWITPEKSLAKSCGGKFEEIPFFSTSTDWMGTGFGYRFSTYNATARETQEKSLWVHLVIGEKKWVIFAQTSGDDIKPVIEIWDDRINIQLKVDNFKCWDHRRIEALYDKLKPYVLYDIPDSDMEERNLQALVLGHCITDWLDKNRPIFKHPLKMASTLINWDIEYETDDAHVSWANIPNFRINIIDSNFTYHHLYGRYILHDMPEKDNKPYWVISDQPIPEPPAIYFNLEKRDQMFIYIFRQHVEYILPENEQWFTGYTKSLVESIRKAMNGSTISDWCRKIQMIYREKSRQYNRAEETLATKRGVLVRTHKESETDKDKKRMNKLISQQKLISIFQEWIEPFIPENKDKYFWTVDSRFYFSFDGRQIAAQRCTEDNGTKYWRIYQNVNFDKPCLEIFSDHIRLHDDSGYFKSFSVNAIRDLGHMIESFLNKEAIYLDPVKKEENIMRIDLKNVAVKVQRQHPHDCIISIGRLNDNEKNQLLNMFPLSIDSLQCRQKVVGRYGNKSVIAQIVPTELMPKTDDGRPIHMLANGFAVTTASPIFQMTITVHLPNIPNFEIYDSDACNILIIDRMIISQTKSTDTCLLYESNWFNSVYSNSDNRIKKVRLSYVAVKVGNKLGDYNCVRIGRIGSCEKELLEQILPSKMLNFKARRVPNTSIERYELELCVQLTDIEDSNNCTIDVLYDEKKPDIICVSNQHLVDEHFFSPWFDPNSQRLSPQIFHIPDEIVKKAIQNIDPVKKEENTMFSKEELDALERITYEEIKKFRDSIPDGCDTPNATIGFKPSEVDKLLRTVTHKFRVPIPTIKEILINKPATIIFWSDGSKTTSVCDDADKFDPQVGISICIAKKYLGGTENLQLEARRALTRYERREAKKLKKNKKTANNKSNQSSKKKK